MLDRFIHKTLKRPYSLKVRYRVGKGKPLVALHGVSSDASTWEPLITHIPETGYELIALDLLGFGKSPKPLWPDYSIRDHARSVVHTLSKLGVDGPITIVGHSMGGIIAADIAYKNPELIEKLVLVSLPLYPDLSSPTGKYTAEIHDAINKAYFKSYRALTKDKKSVLGIADIARGFTDMNTAFELDKYNYHAFEGSLENTIINQQTYQQLQEFETPTTIVNGVLDPLVLGTHAKKLAKQNKHITHKSVGLSSHGIDERLTKEILKALK